MSTTEQPQTPKPVALAESDECAQAIAAAGTSVTPMTDLVFRRKGSINLYKNRRLALCEMSFFKNWIDCPDGDPYPSVGLTSRPREYTGDGFYSLSGSGHICRLLGQYFPYATYDLTLNVCSLTAPGRVGIRIAARACEGSKYAPDTLPAAEFYFAPGVDEEHVRVGYQFFCGDKACDNVLLEAEFRFHPGMHLIVTSRNDFFDLYLQNDRKPIPLRSVQHPNMGWNRHGETFAAMDALLCADLGEDDTVVISSFVSYLDCGISQADIKPVKYEDGTPMMESGKLFLTMSSRMEAGGYQSILSWKPSTGEFALEGALFFDYGDGLWCADVATSLHYNRMTQEWCFWTVSFSHGHVLAHGKSLIDPRYGITCLDAERMPVVQTDDKGRADLSDDTRFAAKFGDEDPDLIYDPESKTWFLTCCRLTKDADGKSNYRYFLFRSEEPFSNFTHVDHTLSGADTGGTLCRIAGNLYLVCGTSFVEHSQYRIYTLPDFTRFDDLKKDYPDGGFRGWGTILPVVSGSRMRYYWITFDRHRGQAEYPWSYGNLYYYEANKTNPVD